MATKTKAPITTPGQADDKKKALETAIAQIEKNYGKGAIMRLGDDIPVNCEALSTGSLSLDMALGIGGVPKGRIIEIYGPEASGKTTLALHIVASAQKNGGEAAYIDVEHALEPAYAQALGVDIDSLLISQPDTGEQALDITESLVRSGAVDVVVIDSVAALIPRIELEGEMGDAVVGALARLMSQAMRRLAGAISKNGCTVVFINQLRQKIGVMILIPVFLVLMYLGQRYWALAVYTIACLSDVADGYIARHYNQVTNFGKFMRAKFTEALGNDLNTSVAVTCVYDALKLDANDATKLALIDDFDRVLSLDLLKKAAVKRETDKKTAAATAADFAVIAEDGKPDADVEAKILARRDAKKAKNFAEADRIRDELKSAGIEVTDIPNGAKWKRV